MQTFCKLSTQLILATLLSLSIAPLMAIEITNTDPATDALRNAEALIGQQKGKQALDALNDILVQYPMHRKTLYTKAKLLATRIL